jgi:hypothetical protein
VTESVTRLRAGTTTDRYGGTVADWSDPDALVITGCAVAPRDAEEDRTNGRQAVIIGFNIYTPAGADVLPTDRLIVRGEECEVDGDPGVWTSPYTDVTEGVEIRTRRVEG